MRSLALLLIGFSVVSAALLALTHFREVHYQAQAGARRMGLLLVFALAGLQVAHWGELYLGFDWIGSAPYRILLFLVAPTFWGFSRPLLHGESEVRLRAAHCAHVLPVVAAPWLSFAIALPLAFAIGAAYLLALARGVYRLRMLREQFIREIFLLGGIFAIAVAVTILGMLPTPLPDKLFFELYAIAIGSAFLLVQIALGWRPHLPEEVVETAKAAYANSTLTRIDRQAALERLGQLMADKAYEDANLSLPGLAARLGLSSHQLSELLNVTLGKGFSRYLREQRVAAAKAMLIREPRASVLAVGLNVGFSTQSTFYEAFRELEGMTPGQYRKLHSGTA